MAEGKAGRIGARLMAVVAEGERGRVYLTPTQEMEAMRMRGEARLEAGCRFFQQALGFRIGNYGMSKWSDLFTARQLVALTTFADLVQMAREQVKGDATAPVGGRYGRSPWRYRRRGVCRRNSDVS